MRLIGILVLGCRLAVMSLYNIKMKILSILLLLYSFSYSQTIDSTKWIIQKNDSLGITFKYPSYFTLNKIESSENNLENAIYLIPIGYEYYDPIGQAKEYLRDNDTTILYLTKPSELTIILSKEDFKKIGSENGYTIKDTLWYDTEMLENGWMDESANRYDFEDWIGYAALTPTSIYFKRGGCWTTSAEGQRYILMKKISQKYNIYVVAEGFDFPQGEQTLQMICNSIEIK